MTVPDPLSQTPVQPRERAEPRAPRPRAPRVVVTAGPARPVVTPRPKTWRLEAAGGVGPPAPLSDPPIHVLFTPDGLCKPSEVWEV